MAEMLEQVRGLANAYREAMAEGDRQLTGEIVERKILQAIVASSAADTLQWVQTRIPDGNAVGKPLEELAPILQKGNVVGTGLKNAQDALVKQAKAAAYGLIITGTAPVWFGAVAAFFLGLFGFAQEAGTSVGAALIPALVGGGSVLYAVMRSLQMSGKALQGTGKAAKSLWTSASSIGSRAESIFMGCTMPRLSIVKGTNAVGGGTPVVTQLRTVAQTIVASGFVVLAICAIFFLAGINNAYNAYKERCPIVLADGTCWKAPEFPSGAR